MRISDNAIDEWAEHGYVIVPDFLTSSDIDAAMENAGRYFPTWDEYAAAPERYPWTPQSHLLRYDGDVHYREAPYCGDALNNLATHPELIDFAKRALTTDRVMLTQSLLWPKYAGTTNFEQELHMDYGDNSLVVPTTAREFSQLAVIIYLTDVTIDLGPTYVVPFAESKGRPVTPYDRSRELDPELYENESPVLVKAGTILAFHSRTFHRGSRMTATEGARFTQHLVFRNAGSEWMTWRGWSKYATTAEMAHFMVQASPEQREVIGFPPVGHSYWNDETISGVAERYPGIDMAPYRRGA